MRILGILLAVSIAFALFKAVLAALLMSYIVLLIVVVIMRPKEGFGFLGFFLLSFLLQEHAVVTLGTFLALCAVCAILKARER